MLIAPCAPDQVFWCYGFRNGVFNADGTGMMTEIFMSETRESAIRFFEVYGTPPPKAMFTVSLAELSHLIHMGDEEVKTGKALHARAPSLLSRWFAPSPWFLVSGFKGPTALTLRIVTAPDPVSAIQAVLQEDPDVQVGAVIGRAEYVQLEKTMENARIGRVAVIHTSESLDPEEQKREELEYLMKTTPNSQKAMEAANQDWVEMEEWLTTEEGQLALREERTLKSQKWRASSEAGDFKV